MLLLLPIAFISGILTVFSPCVLPILPVVLTSGIDGNTRRIKGVIAGLILSFTVFTLILATIVRALGVPVDTVRLIAVVLLIFFAISLIFPEGWQKIQTLSEKYWRFKPIRYKNSGFGGGFFTGVSLGIVWTPCVGPVVGAVATLAAVNSFSLSAVFIALVYALGTGLPLYFIAKGGSKASQKLSFVKKENQKIRQIFGIIILATALFIWSGADRALQAWTLNTLPESWTQLATTFENKFNIRSELDKLKDKEMMKKVQPGQAPLRQGYEGQAIIRDVNLQSDFNGAKVAKEDLIQGCFGKDCIPSVDKPQFESAQEADKWLIPDDLIFALEYRGVVRAYPQRIMNWHEIVNDEANGTPIVVTFCPLCGSALSFERKVDGVITEFGVSGKLHNNDLVMYDRYEGNLWQQITGEAIVGPAARRGEELMKIPIITVPWSQWKKEHPDTQVLSRNTGFSRNYDQYPYGTYEENDELLFGVKDLNRSLQIKTVVYGIEFEGFSKAYPESVFEAKAPIIDSLNGINVKLEKQDTGEIVVTNLDTGRKIIPTRLFWFAWAAFHPETELYQK